MGNSISKLVDLVVNSGKVHFSQESLWGDELAPGDESRLIFSNSKKQT